MACGIGAEDMAGVDLAIQAHTRRGESDAVANWLYVKLALDVFALEWERALTTPEIAV